MDGVGAAWSRYFAVEEVVDIRGSEGAVQAWLYVSDRENPLAEVTARDIITPYDQKDDSLSTVTPSPGDSTRSTENSIIGLIVAIGVVLLLLAVTICVFWRLRKVLPSSDEMKLAAHSHDNVKYLTTGLHAEAIMGTLAEEA